MNQLLLVVILGVIVFVSGYPQLGADDAPIPLDFAITQVDCHDNTVQMRVVNQGDAELDTNLITISQIEGEGNPDFRTDGEVIEVGGWTWARQAGWTHIHPTFDGGYCRSATCVYEVRYLQQTEQFTAHCEPLNGTMKTGPEIVELLGEGYSWPNPGMFFRWHDERGSHRIQQINGKTFATVLDPENNLYVYLDGDVVDARSTVSSAFGHGVYLYDFDGIHAFDNGKGRIYVNGKWLETPYEYVKWPNVYPEEHELCYTQGRHHIDEQSICLDLDDVLN